MEGRLAGDSFCVPSSSILVYYVDRLSYFFEKGASEMEFMILINLVNEAI